MSSSTSDDAEAAPFHKLWNKVNDFLASSLKIDSLHGTLM